jgi:predicted methyltransferase
VNVDALHWICQEWIGNKTMMPKCGQPDVKTELSRAVLVSAMLALSACANVGTTTSAASDIRALSKERIAEIVASPDRSAADRNNDSRRKPEQMLGFIGVRPGIVALDLSAGGGYTTELLARAVGPAGRVYGQSAPRATDSSAKKPAAPEGGAPSSATSAQATSIAPVPPAARPSSPQALAERARNPVVANIIPLVRKFEDPVPPELASGGLDLVTLMFNYHDLGHMGVDRARMNKAVFAALKSGGIYVIADHSGRAGTGISESGTLHRIEEAFLRQEVEAAGFTLADQGNFLRNASDPRDKNTPEPPQPKDEFVLKFVKP